MINSFKYLFKSLQVHTLTVFLDHFQYLPNAHPLELVDSYHLHNQLLQPLRHLNVRWKVNWLFHTSCQHHDVVRLLPRIQVVQHLIKDHSQTPDIALNSIWLSQNNLGRHVDGCSY